ncbi:unnamed protein product [Protopolystoma xenopodis]|uniref:Uncharacterized protein n=1 Tax=Protopolystoma xenopodis TaxID=117903 RepID=A0A448XEV6_9PLAT|nr:unnamed protein product [Protopolystoma xenopodis]
MYRNIFLSCSIHVIVFPGSFSLVTFLSSPLQDADSSELLSPGFPDLAFQRGCISVPPSIQLARMSIRSNTDDLGLESIANLTNLVFVEPQLSFDLQDSLRRVGHQVQVIGQPSSPFSSWPGRVYIAGWDRYLLLAFGDARAKNLTGNLAQF